MLAGGVVQGAAAGAVDTILEYDATSALWARKGSVVIFKIFAENIKLLVQKK